MEEEIEDSEYNDCKLRLRSRALCFFGRVAGVDKGFGRLAHSTEAAIG